MRVSELSDLKTKDVFEKDLKDKFRGVIRNGKGNKSRYFYIPKDFANNLKDFTDKRKA